MINCLIDCLIAWWLDGLIVYLIETSIIWCASLPPWVPPSIWLNSTSTLTYLDIDKYWEQAFYRNISPSLYFIQNNKWRNQVCKSFLTLIIFGAWKKMSPPLPRIRRWYKGETHCNASWQLAMHWLKISELFVLKI